MTNYRLFFGALICVAMFGITSNVEASHTTNASSTEKSSKKYQIAIPILLGISLDDITPNFGDPRGDGSRTHEGLDIMAPEGTPIVSPVKGAVLRTGKSAMPGNYVYVKGSDGHTYAYMHLKDIAKLRKGQKIVVGDLIGTVGDTGNAKGAGSHLHFEIIKSKPIDPYTRISKEFSFEDTIKYLNNAVSDAKNSSTFVKGVVNEYTAVLVEAEAKKIKLNSKLLAALRSYEKEFALEDVEIGLLQGDENDDVRALQYALIRAAKGPEALALQKTGTTGYFGPLTKRALIEFQKASGIVADGTFSEAAKKALLAL